MQYDVRISTAVTCLEHLHDKDVAGFIHYCHGHRVVFVSWGDYWQTLSKHTAAQMEEEEEVECDGAECRPALGGRGI